MNISPKILGIAVLGAFVAGSFIASPELRAYAANTVFSGDITDGEVKTADLANNAVTAAKIKDNEVKAAEIATDAVGAAELQEVTKLIFAQCKTDASEGASNVTTTSLKAINCSITGVDADDSAFATRNSGNQCFDVSNADTKTNLVTVWIRNNCAFSANVGTGMELGVLVYDK